MTLQQVPTTTSTEVVSYLTMRKTIGWLGMLLPFLLLLGNYILNNIGLYSNKWFVELHENYHYESQGAYKSSVSHYYYTTVGEIFTGTLCAVGLFMICYTGHPKRKTDIGLSDNVMTNLAGIFALGVAAFPTTADVSIKDNLRSFVSSGTVGWIHYSFAASFFIVLALMSMINFRRTNNPSLFGKGKDHNFYLWCGILMIVCLILVPVLSPIKAIQSARPTFILEAIALILFGLSWLKKGQADFSYILKKVGMVASPKAADDTR